MEKGNDDTGKPSTAPVTAAGREWIALDNEFVKEMTEKLRALKPKSKEESEYKGLDTFPKPKYSGTVKMISDEVTAVCPITQQPDWYTVTIYYCPKELCVESKSLKLFFHSLRNTGMFCETLAGVVLEEVKKVAKPDWITVTVIQKPRGGISIEAFASSYGNVN